MLREILILTFNCGVVNNYFLRWHFEFAFMFSELGQTSRSAMRFNDLKLLLPSTKTLN